MKKYLLVCLLLGSMCRAQAQKLHAVYEYIPSSAATFREHLYVGNGVKTAVLDSVPVTDTIKMDKDAGDEVSSSFSLVLDEGIHFRHVVVQKDTEQELVETRALQETNYLVTDQFPPLIWDTDYAKTEKLGNYICRKATASYRGTTLVAYYTEEIPVPAGPYKFGGLPGLIVMLYNESANPNYWLLKEVSYPYEGNIPVDEGYLYSLPKMSLKDYIRKDEALVEEQMRIMVSKMPMMDGVTIERQKVRGTVEQVYEWEAKGGNEK